MALVLAYDMSTRTSGGLMKNLATTGATYDGTINGTYTPAPPLIRAKKSPCMDFDGATNWIALTNPMNGLSAWTVVWWANYDATNPVDVSSSANFFLQGAATGARSAPHVVCGAGSFGGDVAPYKQTSALLRTYMFGISKDSSHAGAIYVDGRIYMKGTLAATPADANMNIGRYLTGASNYVNGRLDNFLIYNTALTPDQIWSIYRSANPR